MWGQLWTTDDDAPARFTLFACFVGWPEYREGNPTCFGRLYVDLPGDQPPVCVLTELEDDAELTAETFPAAATALMHRFDSGRWDRRLQAMRPRTQVRHYADPRTVRWFAERPLKAAAGPGSSCSSIDVSFCAVDLTWDGSRYTPAAGGTQAPAPSADPTRVADIELFCISDLIRDM